MYQQIQHIPTPILFLKRQEGDLIEEPLAMFALESFVPVLADQITAGTEETVAGLALQSMLVNGPQPISNSDDYAGQLALQSFVAVTADQSTYTDNDGTGDFALQDFVAVTAQQRSETDNDVTGGFALQSFVIP